MKLQTERIDNHQAQFTIEIDTERLEDAKRKAARKISRQVRIKGFRKGKAPYRLVAQHVGEGLILEEALETLGDALYKQALAESDIAPYGPGAFEEFELEPTPTFVFSVPLQPEVDLKDYREVRVDFEAPEVSADQVEQTLRQMRLQAIEVIDDNVQVAAVGNRVVIAVESEFVDGEPPDEVDEVGEADADSLAHGLQFDGESEGEDEEAPYIPKMGDTFVKDDSARIILDPNDDPFTDGFVEHLIGAELGSDIEFELTIPDDDADETIHGRRVRFTVALEGIEAISIPELDDDFARLACRDRGDEELDLDGLRAAIQRELERMTLSNAKSSYSAEVLGKIVEGAVIDYPEMMLEEHIDDMIGEFERNLSHQNIKLEDYYRLTNSGKEDLQEQYRDRATQSLRRSLVMRELISAQEIEISEDDVELQMSLMTVGHGSNPAARQFVRTPEMQENVRKLIDTPQMRGNIRSELMLKHLDEQLAAIGRGEDSAAAIEVLRAQMAEDLNLAQARNERLQRYQAEDEAVALAEEASSDAESEVLLETETAQPGGESTAV